MKQIKIILLIVMLLVTIIPPGADPWDVNGDTYTNYLDISNLINHYGETY